MKNLKNIKTVMQVVIICLLGFVTVVAKAENDTTKSKKLFKKDTSIHKIDSTLTAIEHLINEIDSLEQFNELELDVYEPYDGSRYNYGDSLIQARLLQIQGEIPLELNSYVKRYIEVYAYNRRDQVEKMLALAPYYFTQFEQVFDSYQMPREFKYLSVVESALNPHAVSRVGATGMWQFMYQTGLGYGMKIDSYTDERRDPFISTDAAARYFRDMYARYGDWLLVIAAYNCGPGNVNKAIRRSGGKTTFWEIMPYLPKETRGYVPAFIAANYVMNYAGYYGLKSAEAPMDLNIDTVLIHRPVTFTQLSEFLDISVEDLKYHNGMYRKSLIPNSALENPHTLRLPVTKKDFFLERRDSLYLVLDSIRTKNPLFLEAYQPREIGDVPTRIVYKIKSGDNLGYIADWFGVSTSQLRSWNNLNGNTIVAGRSLVVYVPEYKADRYANINSMSFSQKQALASGKTVYRETIDKNKGYYTVKSGDTLWGIANRIDGVSAEQLKSWNNITNSNKLMPGMKIRIDNKG